MFPLQPVCELETTAFIFETICPTQHRKSQTLFLKALKWVMFSAKLTSKNDAQRGGLRRAQILIASVCGKLSQCAGKGKHAKLVKTCNDSRQEAG